MKKILKPLQISLVHITILLCAMLFTTTTFACTTAAWLGGASGAVDPNDPNNGVARVKGLCGLELTGTGHVEDESPAAEASFVGHFYFFPNFTGTGSTDIFVAYSDDAATSPAITISYDNGTNELTIDATDIGGGSATVGAAANGWNLVEFAWESDTTGNFWVNADATVDAANATFTPGTGTIDAVRLGSPNGVGVLSGEATFDEYVSNRTQAVGMLLMGDANADSTINIFDMAGVQSEVLGNGLQSGQPDCNLDGNINIFDMACIQNIILN